MFVLWEYTFSAQYWCLLICMLRSLYRSSGVNMMLKGPAQWLKSMNRLCLSDCWGNILLLWCTAETQSWGQVELNFSLVNQDLLRKGLVYVYLVHSVWCWPLGHWSETGCLSVCLNLCRSQPPEAVGWDPHTPAECCSESETPHPDHHSHCTDNAQITAVKYNCFFLWCIARLMWTILHRCRENNRFKTNLI